MQIGDVDDAMARLVSAMSNRQLPPDALANTHLVLSHLLSSHSSQGPALDHRRRAEEFAERTPTSANRARLINIASAAVRAGELDEARIYVARIKELSGTPWSPLTLLTFAVLEAKLLRLSGHRTESTAALAQMIEGCGDGLAIKKEALITLTDFFLSDKDFHRALRTLDHPQLQALPRSQEFEALTIRRSANIGLKQWKLAAEAMDVSAP